MGRKNSLIDLFWDMTLPVMVWGVIATALLIKLLNKVKKETVDKLLTNQRMPRK